MPVSTSLLQTDLRLSIPPEAELPAITYAHDYNDISILSWAAHVHKDTTEVFFVYAGSGDYIENNKSYMVKKGDIIICNQGQLHNWQHSRDYPLKAYMCGIKDLNLRELDYNHLLPQNVSPVIKSGKYHAIIETLYEFILEEAKGGSIEVNDTARYLLCSIISILLKLNFNVSAEEPASASTSLVHQIKQYIADNYTKDLNLKDIAEKFYISPYYMAHLFKKETGFSPMQYIINRRIGEAQTLLWQTNLPISKIGRMVGYENSNYFNIIFKKNTGMTPGKFRYMSVNKVPEE